jgi:hypothetical protein
MNAAGGVNGTPAKFCAYTCCGAAMQAEFYNEIKKQLLESGKGNYAHYEKFGMLP